MNKRILFSIVLFIVTAIYYLPVINIPLAPYDEAVILVGAEKILNGQIPHRDFSSEYPPGQLYMLAALFKIFGTSVITERIYDLAIKTLLSLSIFSIISLLTSWRTALLGWLMSIIWLQQSTFPAYPVYPSMLFIFISIYLLLLNMEERKNHYVILSAVSIVFSILFRHDLGGYAAIAILIMLIIKGVREGQSWHTTLIFILSGIIAGSPVLIYFYLNSSIGALFNDLVLIPMAFLEKQTLPYPSFSRWSLPFFMFPLVMVAGAFTSIILLKRNKIDSEAYAILLISLIGIFCFNQARMRSDIVHLLPVALTGILLAPVLLHTLSGRVRLNPFQKQTVYILFITGFGITLSKPVTDINLLLSRTNGYVIKAVSPDIERASYSIISTDLKDAVAYIKNKTLKDDRIYVGVKNHDQFVFNDVVIYFLAERNCATRYHVLNPGVQTTLKVQEEIIHEFRESPPRLIVLVPRSRYEPNLSSVDLKTDLLDKYISTNYKLEKTFGMYEIWM